jgi:hypothetical protein
MSSKRTMNSRLCRVFALTIAGVASALAAHAATVTFDAPLHLRPASDAPVLATLPAGTSVVILVREELAAEGIDALPTGWVATRFNGPINGYVETKDVAKGLFAKAGAVIRAGASTSDPIITMVNESDQADVASVEGDWAKVVLRKEILLFFNPLPPSARPSASSLETGPAPAPSTSTMAPAPRSGRAPAVRTGPNPADAAPRVFQGYLARTRRILGTGPKLDYQLVDESNRRIALLDFSALLLTEPIENYEGRPVSIFGPAVDRPEAGGLVIRVETLRLAR